ETTRAWFREKKLALPYPAVAPGEDVPWEIDEELDLSQVEPLIAKPFSPANASAASEVARERLSFDKAFIGSCTNGGYSDLLEAAVVLKAARAKGTTGAARAFVEFPGSGGVKRDIEEADPRVGGAAIADLVRPDVTSLR